MCRGMMLLVKGSYAVSANALTTPPASSVGSCQIEEHRNVIDSEKQAANTSSNIESVALSVDNAE